MKDLLVRVRDRINDAKAAPVTVTRGDGSTVSVDLSYLRRKAEIVGVGAPPPATLGPDNLPCVFVQAQGRALIRWAAEQTTAALQVRLGLLVEVVERGGGVEPRTGRKTVFDLSEDLRLLLDDHRFSAAYDTAFVVADGTATLAALAEAPFLVEGTVDLEYTQAVVA